MVFKPIKILIIVLLNKYFFIYPTYYIFILFNQYVSRTLDNKLNLLRSLITEQK